MSKSARIAAPAPQPDPPADDPLAVDAAELLAASIARVEHRLRLLDEMAEMVMKLARGVTEQGLAAKAAPANTAPNDAPGREASAPDTADGLAKLSRALRLTLDLAGRLEETLRHLRSGEAAARETRRRERQARDARAVIDKCEARQGRVIEQVTMAIHREAESEADSCDLLKALDERLEDDIAYVDLDGGPLREMVEKLCGDLGLSPDWSRWTDEGWPEPPHVFFANRSPWSPFNRPSRKPLLYKNRDYERREFDVIDRSP
ncbi:MAG: hypothetical protein JWO83_1327 [Caulobacteraceae bacterium]|jgi:hypothetical protein|nr:hypothetical protein [Caulobacteraceae bacterium]